MIEKLQMILQLRTSLITISITIKLRTMRVEILLLSLRFSWSLLLTPSLSSTLFQAIPVVKYTSYLLPLYHALFRIIVHDLSVHSMLSPVFYHHFCLL